MPAKPPPPFRPGDDGTTYSELAPTTPEQVRGLGKRSTTLRDLPPRAAPPLLRSPPELDSQPPPTTRETALHAPHGRFQQTLTGVAPPARGAAPEPIPSLVPPVAPRKPPPPPRSISPSPESVAAQVTIGDTPLPPIRKRHLRALWVWVGPIVVTALTSAYGYVRGYAKGLADAAERLARIEQAAKTEGTKRAALEQRVTVTEDDLNHAFAVNRDQDKKNADEDAAIERLGQRVTELARQKPIVVKPER